MLEHLLLPCMVTVAAIALSAILFKGFLKKREGQTAVEEGSADIDSATENGTVERAARTCTTPQVEETATSSRYDYEVFLSFRGPDTRSGFTDFLYTYLIDAGIRTFRDDDALPVGEEFAPELLEAINQSKISIPIFSKNYASSVWCLKEVVQMVERKKTGGHKIMPIFYDVTPSEVRHQTGVFKKALVSHKTKGRCDEDTIAEWKNALTTVADINGWDLQSTPNRQEGQFAKRITQEVFKELTKPYLVVSNCLVNVDNHVDEIMEKIGAHTSETRIVGIHGMGGVGKTTIAKLIYNKLSNKYDDRCFLSNIHETSEHKGICYLQQQLIFDILKMERYIKNIDEGIEIIEKRLSNKKVLLLLDDVGKKDHMDALVGKRDWFGKGSTLIITTRNKEVLDVLGVDLSYELKSLDLDLSLQLFSKHAFRRDSPIDECINQSKRAVQIAGGLPLALEVIGSLLSCTKKEMWDAKLKKLERVPEVQSKLKISYDALDDQQQRIFLDIACHFIGYHKDIVVYFWDASELSSEVDLEVLQNMSLIKIEKHNKLWMHDQLRDLGREIVRQESSKIIEKQHWVWNPKQGLDLLKSDKMKKKVKALYLKFDGQHHFTYEDFKKLPNLMFLEVEHLQQTGPLDILSTYVNLLPQLRWLSWHNIHPTFEITNFSMENVTILDLSRSEITHDWKGWSHMKVIKNLKVLDLNNCKCLKITPDLSAHSKLERLILWGCASLNEIHRSICQLKCLVFLDVSDCSDLQRLPNKLDGDLASLKYLVAKNCECLETIGNLELLTDLDIRGTSIEELPDSIGKMKNLKVVKMYDTHISKISDEFWTIEKLEEIKVSRHYSSGGDFQVEIGNCIYGNKSLRILRLRNAIIHVPPKLPESLIKLELKLRVDTFPDLSNLANLKVLDLHLGVSNCDGKSDGLLEEPIPSWIGNLSQLESLNLRILKDTFTSADLILPPHPRSLPRLPSNLSSLYLFGFYPLYLMDLLNLRKLSSLSIRGSAVAEIEGLGCLENLRDLQLEYVEQLVMLPDLSKLNKLRCIRVYNCRNLVEIQGELPRFLDILIIYYCDSLREFPDLFNLMGKTYVNVGIGNQMFNYTDGHRLLLRGFKQMQIPDLSNWNRLRTLSVESCHNLVEIQGELPKSLEYLDIESCESLQKLPDLSSLKGMQEVRIRCCRKLAVEDISRLCSEKSIKFLGEDDEEDKLPDWARIRRYVRR